MRWLPLLAALLASPAAAQIPSELQQVKRWHMSFDYEETASHHAPDEDWTLAITASGTAVLERTDDPFGQWTGTPSIHVNYSYVGFLQLTADCRYEDDITGSGSPIDVEGSASLRFFQDGYQLDPSTHFVPVNDEFHYICPDEKVTTLQGKR